MENKQTIEDNCTCYSILQREKGEVIFHLTGCEEHFETKEYDSLSWYEKIFKYNPRNYLLEHYK